MRDIPNAKALGKATKGKYKVAIKKQTIHFVVHLSICVTRIKVSNGSYNFSSNSLHLKKRVHT